MCKVPKPTFSTAILFLKVITDNIINIAAKILLFSQRNKVFIIHWIDNKGGLI